jgi:hypothetical protein
MKRKDAQRVEIYYNVSPFSSKIRKNPSKFDK